MTACYGPPASVNRQGPEVANFHLNSVLLDRTIYTPHMGGPFPPHSIVEISRYENPFYRFLPGHFYFTYNGRLSCKRHNGLTTRIHGNGPPKDGFFAWRRSIAASLCLCLHSTLHTPRSMVPGMFFDQRLLPEGMRRFLWMGLLMLYSPIGMVCPASQSDDCPILYCQPADPTIGAVQQLTQAHAWGLRDRTPSTHGLFNFHFSSKIYLK